VDKTPFTTNGTSVRLFNTKADAQAFVLDRVTNFYNGRTVRFGDLGTQERFASYRVEPWLSTSQLFKSELWSSFTEEVKFDGVRASHSFDTVEADYPSSSPP
jgi:hypothetical protein